MADMKEANENVLDMELTEDQENFLREHLENWKEEVTANLMEEVTELKEKTLEELEVQNEEYKQTLKEESAQKLIDALSEMKDELRAEVIAEMYEDNPELKVLESIKEIVAPTLNEEYVGNMYAEELQTLREKVEELEYEKEIDEGARTLAELIAPYEEKTQDILISLIPEGNAEEVTEKFYEIVEKFEDDDEDIEEDDDEEEGEEEDDDEEEGEEEDDDEEEGEEEEENEDTDEEFESFINEDTTENNSEKPSKSSVRNYILDSIKR